MQPLWNEYAGPWALAEALAAAVAGNLRRGVIERGAATLVVSGGNTPRRFLETLARETLPWAQTTITLADERWVPPDHARSNERLLRETLLRGAAATARFVPLYRAAPTPDSAIAQIEADLDALSLPFDVVVLGMGTDGHCASLFPGADNLAEAMQADGTKRVLPMRAPAAEEPRITLTLAALTQARAMYLHIEGAQKRTVLEQALTATATFTQAPVADVLRRARTQPHIFHCP